MSKYEVLAKYLQELAERQREVTLSFKELEEVLRFELPPSARKRRSWWANSGDHAQAREGWLRAGWVVENVDLEGKNVTFKFNPTIKLIIEETRRVTDQRRSLLLFKRYNFEDFARRIMSEHLGASLMARKGPGWPRTFDLVSPDYRIVGEAIYQEKFKGAEIPPGKLTYISEIVWLLEKVSAEVKFIVFGGDERVPKAWLTKYGPLLKDIKFYFLNEEGSINKLA